MNETTQTVTLSEMLRQPVSERRDGSVALTLGVGGAIASLLALPYGLAMTKGTSPSTGWLLASFVANFVIISLLTWIGLRAGERLGLDSPGIRGWFVHDTKLPPSHWLSAIGLGIAAAIAAWLLQLVLPLPVDSIDIHRIPVWWQGLLASFQGGIVEEAVFRLFLVSVLAWLAARVCKPSPAIYWFAIVVAAALFGAAHLPNWSAISHVPVSRAIAASIVSANAVCGIAFGWLFWRFGLEHAIAAHFSTDIVLHVIGPLFLPHG
ncbi:MAG: CPBP family intramembrane metalloprotease [Proteobacteria bacterium]|nr:CPBP family intramembrane metalloprotease [Pseudomonadota bacterium]